MVQAVDANGVQNMADKIRHSVQRVIVGKDDVIDLAIIALLCKGHVLVEDVPGIGKTTMAKALAQSLGCTFNRIQFTPDLMPTDVLGVNFYNQKSGDFEFRAGPIFSQILLADEINRATPRTQSALLEAMGERQATIDGVTRAISEPFMVLATQNPIEMEGTFPLPEAQLDRFMLRIKLGYPSPDEESDILLRFQKDTILPALDPVTTESELRPLQDAVTTVRVDDTIRMYVVAITQATREHDGLSLGASPRAALSLYKTAQAKAALDARDFVTPDDVKGMAETVLAHRMILTSNSRLRGRTTEMIVEEVLDSVPVPIER
ncbi:MAG TPA: MoxR family ATPase [Dehalococcoidia bacterium]|jgi:MoxR-like ATPase|nr:MoxR family ATPase [Dehalococcoidia bacterium]HIA15385.1 MoxR family ATPase [Dehalococcoidia bacterium]HIN71470.1 MoxR family ATPase [Dehalococcoidia bacterium]HIO64596.1 MoxR family ATPase [Dehalococcoidia bacterium]|tara:strand:- start:466 stop:1425 length:960 start_codon:yes stop_codon:yes gene_type:complete